MGNFRGLDSWKDKFQTQHVQPVDVKGGDFLSSESVVLCSGPPVFDATNLVNIAPVGLVQNASVSQNKQIQQVFELGSRKPYFIPGRTYVNVGISRILFDGPSLMHALYINKADGAGNYDLAASSGVGTSGDGDLPTKPFNPDDVTGITYGDDTNAGEFFSNLASSYFNNPLGLALILYDGEMQSYGGIYLESCYIQNYNLGFASQQTVIAENVSIRVTNAIPLGPDSLAGASTSGSNTVD